MANDDRARDIAAAGLGLLALALGAATILGVVRPTGGVVATGIPVRGIVALVVGFVGLYLARSRGFGRQLAVLGTAVALVGLAFYGGAIAIEALIAESQ